MQKIFATLCCVGFIFVSSTETLCGMKRNRLNTYGQVGGSRVQRSRHSDHSSSRRCKKEQAWQSHSEEREVESIKRQMKKRSVEGSPGTMIEEIDIPIEAIEYVHANPIDGEQGKKHTTCCLSQWQRALALCLILVGITVAAVVTGCLTTDLVAHRSSGDGVSPTRIRFMNGSSVSFSVFLDNEGVSIGESPENEHLIYNWPTLSKCGEAICVCVKEGQYGGCDRYECYLPC